MGDDESSTPQAMTPPAVVLPAEAPPAETPPAVTPPTAESVVELAEVPDGAVVGAEDADVPVDSSAVEALLLATHHPLTAARLAELLGCGAKAIRAAVAALNGQYETTSRSFRIEQVAGGFQLLTLPAYGEILNRLHSKEADAKLTKSALETLSVVAYKQPVLRADVEAIRGVACGETLRSLMEKHLVRIAGRAEEPGRPILYGTTKRFLELFGLNTLRDLPTPASGVKPSV